jgi:RND family efflux transporter MFP subunit
MKKAAYCILLLLLVAGVFVAGFWYGQRGAIKPSTPGASQIVHRVDSTHSAHTSDTVGIAPVSALSVEPVDAHGGASDSGRGSDSVSPGTVNISPERQQLIGVRVSPVEKASGTHALRILGRIAPDEKRLYRLKAPVDGWIREVSPVTTGSQVEKDQLLATFSAQDLVLSAQQYIFALNSMDRLTESSRESPAQLSPVNSNFRQRIERLQSLGMSANQMEEIGRTREIPQGIKIFAPAAGFVLARNVSLEEKFEKGAEWYRIADLSRVWILADVFQNEAQYLQPGKTVKVSLPQQRRTFQAKVSAVRPQFDPATRTLKVRLEAENPEDILRPDMFVDVELPITLPLTITVPADAVLDSGLKKTVFVDRGNGYFEPREVETGWRMGNRVEIVKGLEPGERIVISGNFLIDSESKLELAAQGMYTTLSKDPVCGVDVSMSKAAKAGRKSIYQEKTYYFSSDECKQQFEKNPSRYVRK